jgi:hypothetical protein
MVLPEDNILRAVLPINGLSYLPNHTSYHILINRQRTINYH